MEHFISVCAERGNRCSIAGKVELGEAMTFLSTEALAGEEKSDCVLIFNGYKNTTNQTYARNERELDLFSTIFIDVDNPNNDPNLLDDFKKAMANYDYWIYETYSSTKDRPKFRAIIPMDAEMEWNRNMKIAIFRTFQKFADEKASWFYSPTKNRLSTVEHHTTGRLFPSRIIMGVAERLANQEQMDTTWKVVHNMRAMMRSDHSKLSRPDAWRFLPSVKKCLEGLNIGERDNSLCAACYAMDNHGYRSSIHEFLDEVNVDRAIKDKWRRRYR